jgi:hypothetical protein
MVVQVQPGQKGFQDSISKEKLDVVVCACHPSYGEKPKVGGSRSKPVRAKSKTLSQNNQSKKGWRCGSSARVPAEQMQSPEFKPQNCQILVTLVGIWSLDMKSQEAEPQDFLQISSKILGFFCYPGTK